MAASVRKANAADASAIAHVYVHSWRSTYGGILPAHTLKYMSENQETLAWWRSLCRANAHDTTFVAQTQDGRVVGFASAGPDRRGALRRRAELYTLYLLDQHHRKGIGSALVQTCARDMLDQGTNSLVVWVLAKNPARKFYEALGGVPHGRKPIRVGGRSVQKVAYLWPDLEALVAVASR